MPDPPLTAAWPPPHRRSASTLPSVRLQACIFLRISCESGRAAATEAGAHGCGGAGRAPQQPRGTMYTNSEFIGSMPAIELDDGDDGLTEHLQPGAMHSSHGVADCAKVRRRVLSPCGQHAEDGACRPAASSRRRHSLVPPRTKFCRPATAAALVSGQNDLCCPPRAGLRASRNAPSLIAAAVARLL